MMARLVGLPTSSSGVRSRVIGRLVVRPWARMVRTAWKARKLPAFMSKMPGPYARSPSMRKGMSVARWPWSHTVSTWPETRIGSVAGAGIDPGDQGIAIAVMAGEAFDGWRRPRRRPVSARSSSRLTAAGSVVGVSISTQLRSSSRRASLVGMVAQGHRISCFGCIAQYGPRPAGGRIKSTDRSAQQSRHQNRTARLIEPNCCTPPRWP